MNSEDIESLLECSVCLEQLDGTHKVLPCQHTFCRRCLEGIIRKSRKKAYLCPECRTEFNTPLDELPSNIILNRILESLCKKSSTPPSTPEIKNCSSVPSLPPKPPTNRAHQVYRALYDYKPCQSDELELKQSELYIVIEKRKDAWFKGYSIQTLKTGFFPGNYVQHIMNDRKPLEPQTASSQDKDLIDFRSEPLSPSFKDQMEVYNTQRTIVPPNVTPPSFARIPQPGGAASASRERYKCIASFPASGKYELNMEEGDIVFLISKRDDGWCKGTLERTGQVGLFPYSFVKNVTN